MRCWRFELEEQSSRFVVFAAQAASLFANKGAFYRLISTGGTISANGQLYPARIPNQFLNSQDPQEIPTNEPTTDKEKSGRSCGYPPPVVLDLAA